MGFIKINKLNLQSTIDKEDIINVNKSILNSKKEGREYNIEHILPNPSSYNRTKDNLFIIEDYEVALHGYNIGKKDIKNAFKNASLEFEITKK